MLTEKRQEEILRLLTVKGSVTVQELKEQLHASESTIRRDLNQMHQEGALVKYLVEQSQREESQCQR